MTVQIGIAGLRGRMGREIADLAVGDPRVTVVGGLSRSARGEEPGANGIPIFVAATDLLSTVDVLIDFSTPESSVALASSCAAVGVPLVCGTTGLSETQMAAVRVAAERVAIFHAANMSPGINAIIAVLPRLMSVLQDYDVEIVETHHRHKADAPSGTALALAGVVTNASEGDLEGRARYGREGPGAREPGEIGIHAIRAGGNPGEHTVILAGDGEEIRLSHRAFSRRSYAEGALRAARLIVGLPAGWYEPATLPGYL
jgi:4-hydroxy-tetrahydrodipicolinate reductase